MSVININRFLVIACKIVLAFQIDNSSKAFLNE